MSKELEMLRELVPCAEDSEDKIACMTAKDARAILARLEAAERVVDVEIALEKWDEIIASNWRERDPVKIEALKKRGIDALRAYRALDKEPK